MNSKQQDVYGVVKILSLPTEGWSDAGLSGSLLLSPSETNAAVKRTIHCGLMRPAFGEETNRRPVACLDIHREAMYSAVMYLEFASTPPHEA